MENNKRGLQDPAAFCRGKLTTIREYINIDADSDTINQENLRACVFLLQLGIVTSLLLIVLEPVFMKRASYGGIACLCCLLFLGGMYLMYRGFVSSHATIVVEITIAVILVVMAYEDAATHPDMPVFTFPILLIILPMLILDRPWKLYLMTLPGICTALFFTVSSGNGLMEQKSMVRLVVVSIVMFITAGRNAHRKMESLQLRKSTRLVAEHDPLTKVYNRGGGTMLIRECVNRGQSGAFLIIDVDDFKHVNDNYGHQRGDMVLQQIAQTLQSSFKGTDIVMRMGGDEFIVYAIGMVDYQVTLRRLDHLVDAIHQVMISEEDGKHATVSIGCAINNGSYPTYESLYRSADRFLYKAKEKGKDGYCVLDINYKGD